MASGAVRKPARPLFDFVRPLSEFARLLRVGALFTGALLVFLAVGVPPHGAPAHAAAPDEFTATAGQAPDGTVTISWRLADPDPALTGFRVERVDVEAASGTARAYPVGTVAADRDSISDPLADVEPGPHRFAYEITALAGTVPLAVTTAFPPELYHLVPSAPSAVTSVVADRRVTVSWSGPEINGSRLTGYRVQRRIGPTGGFATLVDSTPRTSLVDDLPALPTGVVDVWYRIISLAAERGGGRVEPVNRVFVEVPGEPTRPRVRMSFEGAGGVLDWAPPTVNVDLLDGYRLARSVGGEPAVPITTLPASQARYVDTFPGPVAAGTAVTYTITALAAEVPGGEVPVTLTVGEAPPPPETPTATVEGRTLRVDWATPAAGEPAGGYRLRYRAGPDEPWRAVPELIDPATPRARIDGLTNGVTYEVAVAAVDVPDAAPRAWSPVATGRPGTDLPITGDGPVRIAAVAALAIVGGALLLFVLRYRRVRFTG
jgi:hypothetical protein